MNAKLAFAIAMLAMAASPAARADSEASNVPHVATDDNGRCFAHSVPAERYGTAGRTDVYAVGAGYPPNEELALIHSYDWFAQQIYVACNVSDGKGAVGHAVVQRGPWPRGHRPDDKIIAVAFHYNGAKLAEYSTLDIADGNPKNASCSVSHYTVIKIVEGFVRNGGADTLFRLTTIDGRRLTFNALTGALVDTEQGAPAELHGECYADIPIILRKPSKSADSPCFPTLPNRDSFPADQQ